MLADLGGGFADQVTEEVELGAASETGLFDFDFHYNRCVEWENLFDSDATGGDLADYKSGIVFGVDSDHDAFKDLDTGFVPFFDTLMNADGVSDVESNFFVGCLVGHVGNYNRVVSVRQHLSKISSGQDWLPVKGKSTI